MPISEPNCVRMCMPQSTIRMMIYMTKKIFYINPSIWVGGEVKMIFWHQTLNARQMPRNKPNVIVKIRLFHTRKKHHTI